MCHYAKKAVEQIFEVLILKIFADYFIFQIWT